MNTSWQKVFVKEVIEFDTQRNVHKNIAYVGLEDIESHTGKFLGSVEPKQVKSTTYYFSKKHVLYGRLRPYLNKVLLPDFEGHCSTEIFPIKLTKEIDKKYFYYWITSDLIVSEINRTCTGARMPRANLKAFLDFSIPLPPLAEQQRIVDILDQSFAAIDQAIANTEKNLQNAKELFESYTYTLFTNVDDNWEKIKLGKLCKFVRGPFGGSLKKSIFVDNGYAIYEQTHAIYDQFERIRYYIDENKFREMKRFELHAGEIIMSCSGTMGKVAIVPPDFQKGIINQALLKLTPNPLINNQFLKYWMESKDFQKKMSENSKGAAIKNVASVSILKEIEIRVPSLPIQFETINCIKEFSTKTHNLINNYEQKISALAELKQSILHKAFAGELT